MFQNEVQFNTSQNERRFMVVMPYFLTADSVVMHCVQIEVFVSVVFYSSS